MNAKLCIFVICLAVAVQANFINFHETERELRSAIPRSTTPCQKDAYECLANGSPCTATSHCGFYSFCDLTSGKCAPVHIAGACSDDDECGDPNPANIFISHGSYGCVNGNCKFFAPIGGSCSTADDCNDQHVTCTKGICTLATEGATCSASSQCADGLYCADSKTCQKRIAVGSTCNPDDDGCTFPSICGFGNKCVKAFATAVGGDCSTANECEIGLACPSSSNKCTKAVDQMICSVDSNCNATGYNPKCSCNHQTGTGTCALTDAPSGAVFAGCNDQYDSVVSCLTKNKCPSTEFDAGNCAQKHCIDEYVCYYNCYYTKIYAGSAKLETCIPNGIPKCSSASTMVASALVIVLTLCLALI